MGKFVKGGPPTATTRRGNGAGWGGPAKGAGKIGGPGRPKGIPDGQGKKAQAQAALEEAAPLAVQTVIDLAGNLSDPRALQAAVAILNRVGMHEKAGLEHSGAVGFTVVTGVERAED